MSDNIIRNADGVRVGYIGHFTGAYICDTCGAYCECNEDEEEAGEE